MAANTVESNPSTLHGDKHKHMDREIKDMISTLTMRLNDLHHVHKPGSSHEEERGVGVITLAGTNVGATMKGELLHRGHDEKCGHDHHHEDSGSDEVEGLDTCVNSNFQAVNNSIMFSASYSANDPDVHMEVVDLGRPRGYNKHEKFEMNNGVKIGKGVAHGHHFESEY